MHRAEGVRYLTSGPWSDMDVAIERYMDVLERVLKKGTARPRLPDKLTVSWSTVYLELKVFQTGITQRSMLFCANEK